MLADEGQRVEPIPKKEKNSFLKLIFVLFLHSSTCQLGRTERLLLNTAVASGSLVCSTESLCTLLKKVSGFSVPRRDGTLPCRGEFGK